MVAQVAPPSRPRKHVTPELSLSTVAQLMHSIVTTLQANQILRPSGGPSAVQQQQQQQLLAPLLMSSMMQQQQAQVQGGQPYSSPGGQQQQQQVRAKMVQHEQLLRQIRAMGRPPNAFALFAASLAR